MRNTQMGLLIVGISLIFIGCAAPAAQDRQDQTTTTDTQENASTLSLAEDSDTFMVEDASSDATDEAMENSLNDTVEPVEEAIDEATAAEADKCVDRVRALEPSRWRITRFLDNLSDERIADICDQIAEQYAKQIDLLKSYEGKTIVALAAKAITGNSDSDTQNCGKLYIYVLQEASQRFELDHTKDTGTCDSAESYGAGLAGVMMQAQDENGDTYYKYGTVGLLYGPSGAVVRLRTPHGTALFGASVK